MKTIVIASQKGGSGKTTTVLHLGTLAQVDGPTLLIDCDPQGSLAFWGSRRDASTPVIVPIGTNRLQEVTETARGEGIEWVLVDTAPHDSAGMAAAMRAADLVLIPTRPSAFDLHAVEATITMAKTLGKRALVVLSQTPAKRGIGDPQAVREARDLVEAMGAKVAEVYVASRIIASQSVVAGQSVGEIEPDGSSAQEFAALWAEVKKEL